MTAATDPPPLFRGAIETSIQNSVNDTTMSQDRTVGSPFRMQERVRWIDCDAAQIIHYGSYIRFFEIAETEMYRSVGLAYATAFDEIDAFPIRAAYHCDYKHPARLDDLMTIEVWISHVGTTSYTISFRFLRASDDELLAEGYCRAVTVDRRTKQKVEIPERLREAIAGFVVEQEGAG